MLYKFLLEQQPGQLGRALGTGGLPAGLTAAMVQPVPLANRAAAFAILLAAFNAHNVATGLYPAGQLFCYWAMPQSAVVQPAPAVANPCPNIHLRAQVPLALTRAQANQLTGLGI